MIFAAALAALVMVSYLPFVSAAPFSFPLSNGFPTISNPSTQLTIIEQQAHGSLPSGSLPPTISDNSKTSLRLVAFNELFEVAFFTELISNITNSTGGTQGYEIEDRSTRKTVLDALNAVVAQEELHALNANNALANFKSNPIQPCKYDFPVDAFSGAMVLASTFTDAVLGTLQEVQTLFATDGDASLISGVGSIIGQEGEQNGFYRNMLGKIPSALPFLTTMTREFAFSSLNQDFVVPGSCPNIDEIDLPVFATLTVVTPDIQPKSQNIQFSFDTSKDKAIESRLSGLSLVYINQQNNPVVENLQDVQVQNSTVLFTAQFPFDEATFGNGFTIAAVTNSSGPFSSAGAVANATLFGPGLIEIN
ncbi:related to sexual development protein (LsdA) [Phialocephala subalpina]|uniref:Related to sexual development protein (LsdA) n=1 Tax=Phialocephala subalpina TaxID=576137 RepID=A0A1L7XDQ2_9HELO|nr:related to sexual development protein (LsdA) [Phialocephala subalpina]